MSNLNGKRMFPCPVCISPHEIKLTKKGKPYITCDPCGIQRPRAKVDVEAVRNLRSQGKSLRNIAMTLGVPISRVRRALAAALSVSVPKERRQS